jgi:hypothetical protein
MRLLSPELGDACCVASAIAQSIDAKIGSKWMLAALILGILPKLRQTALRGDHTRRAASAQTSS